MTDNIQKNINQISQERYNALSQKGIDAIKEMFSTGKTMQERLKVNSENEYIKRMLIAQMDLDGMLLVHKYFNKGFDGISEFREESDKIRAKAQTDSILNFDEDTIESLFGNSLNITSEEECEKWKQLVYSGEYLGKDINTLYDEEKFKSQYEKEKNIIKKIIQSFKYKKLFKQDTLEDSHIKKVRGLLREQIIANPEENAGYIITESRSKFEQGIVEYNSLRELESISKVTLSSLQQSDSELVSIEEECAKTRNMLNEDNPSKFDTNYRKRQVTLGTDRGISTGPVIETIPFEEIPKAMQELQERYENAYNTSENEEEYIKEVIKIYADFVYIQPYEDGNKRTATCLLNKMLLSRGIIPPPISLANGDEQLGEAFSKAHDKDYTMLQDLIFSKYENIKSTMDENSRLEKHENNKMENEKVER